MSFDSAVGIYIYEKVKCRDMGIQYQNNSKCLNNTHNLHTEVEELHKPNKTDDNSRTHS